MFIKKLITGTYSNNQMHSAKFLVQTTKISGSLDHELTYKLSKIIIFWVLNEIQPSEANKYRRL